MIFLNFAFLCSIIYQLYSTCCPFLSEGNAFCIDWIKFKVPVYKLLIYRLQLLIYCLQFIDLSLYEWNLKQVNEYTSEEIICKYKYKKIWKPNRVRRYFESVWWAHVDFFALYIFNIIIAVFGWGGTTWILGEVIIRCIIYPKNIFFWYDSLRE